MARKLKIRDKIDPYEDDEEEVDPIDPYDEEEEGIYEDEPEKDDDEGVMPQDIPPYDIPRSENMAEKDEKEDAPETSPEDVSTDISTHFNNFMDDRGRMPAFFDGAWADNDTREEGINRQAYYEMHPDQKPYNDYDKTLSGMAEALEEEEQSVGDRIGEGIRVQMTKAIRAWNDLTDSTIRELEPIKSNEDDWLVSMVGSYGGLMAGSAIVTAAAPGFLVGGLMYTGVAMAHSYISTFDVKENLENYESIVADLLGTDGFIDEQTPELSRAKMAWDIYKAELADGLVIGAMIKGAGKGLKFAARSRRKPISDALKEQMQRADELMSEEGFFRLWGDAKKNKPIVPDSSLSNTEHAEYLKDMSKDVSDYIGDLKDVDTNVEVLDALHKRRKILEPLVNRKVQKDRISRSDVFWENAKKDVQMDRFLLSTPDAVSYARRAGRALDNLKAGRGDRAKELDRFRGYLAQHHDTTPTGARKVGLEGMTREDVAKQSRDLPFEDTYLKGTKMTGSEVDKHIQSQQDLFDLYLREMRTPDPDLVYLKNLESAYNMARQTADDAVSKSGGTMQAWQHYEQRVGVADKLEKGILKHLSDAKNLMGKQAARSRDKASKLINERKKRIDLYRSGKESTAQWVSTIALRATVDQALSLGAFTLATVSSIFSGAAEVTYYFVKKAQDRRNPFTIFSMLKRSKSVTGERLKSRYGTKDGWKQFWGEWDGSKRPIRQRFNVRKIEETTPWGKAANVVTGFNVMMMREADHVLSSILEPLSEQVALQRVVARMQRQGKNADQVTKELKDAISGKGSMDLVVAYDQEVTKSTDWLLMRADTEPGRGWLQTTGHALHRAAEWGKMHHNPAANYLGGTIGLFSKSFANSLTLISSNSWLDGWKAQKYHPAMRNRKNWGTAMYGTAAGLMYMQMNDPDGLFQVVKTESGQTTGFGDINDRRWGGESGIRFGGNVLKWSYFGWPGELTRAFYAFWDITQLTVAPLVGVDKYPMHSYEEKVMMAGQRMLEFIIGNSWVELGLGRFLKMITAPQGEKLERGLKQMLQDATPGQGLYGRLNAGFTGEAKSNPYMLDFITAVDKATPRAARRDDIGVRWTEGEEREGTRESVDLFGSVWFMFNPIARKGQPKSNELRDWVRRTGGFNHDTLKVGDRWIKIDRIKLALGTDRINMRGPDKSVKTNYNTTTQLSPDELNNKRAIMSMDHEHTDKLIDAYIFNIRNKDHTGQLGKEAIKSIKLLNAMKDSLSARKMRPVMKYYYPGFDEDTRMVDVLHHMAVAPMDEQSKHMRSVMKSRTGALRRYYRSKLYHDPSIEKFTEEELEDMSDRITRLAMMNDYYKFIDNQASIVMMKSPEVDDLNDDLYNQTVR